MGAVPLIGFGAFVVASLVVGTRLLLAGSRSGALPELVIGTSLLAGGGVGYLLVVLTLVLHLFPPPMLHAGVFLIYLGTAATSFGVWRIFRPGQVWAGALCALLSAILALAFGARLLASPDARATSPWHFWPSTIAGTATYAWTALESLRYHELLRRRVSLDLAEPEMARRFLLWGCSALAAVGIHVSSMMNRFIDPQHIGPAILALQSLLGLVSAVSIWFAFFPPAWFQRLFAPRAAA